MSSTTSTPSTATDTPKLTPAQLHGWVLRCWSVDGIHVQAHRLSLRDGALVFMLENDITEVYAPGAWRRVTDRGPVE